MPCAVLLSGSKVDPDIGCVWTSSMSAVNASCLASAADDMTFFIVVQRMLTAPLFGRVY
jgi:hypothetical protein